MPSPAQHAALAQLATALAAAPHGGRGALIAQAAAALGVCPATVQAWLRGHRGPRRQHADSLARLVAQREEQATRDRPADAAGAPAATPADADALAARAALTAAEADLISTCLREAGRANGKQLMSLKQAVATLRTQGLIRAERLDPATGEVQPLSLSAISRYLTRYGLHPEQLRAPTPHQALRTAHPNARWEVDASVCVVYYLPTGALIQDIDPTRHYKNRPEHLAAIATERVIRYVLTDHTTNATLWRYYPHAESGATTVAFLAWAVAPKTNPAIPVQGAPFRLVVDPGATAAGTVQRWCDLLGIELAPTRPKNPRAKGSVEQAQNRIETVFESGLRHQSHRIKDFNDLNALAETYQAHYGAHQVVGRHGLTRYAAWARITPEQLRLTEGEAVLRALATQAPATPKVGGDLTVAYRGQRWRVQDLPGVAIGAKLAVLWCPLLGAAGTGHAVAVLTDPETGLTRYQPLPMVERDDWGFDSEAPLDGEAYARLPDTQIDRNRKRLALLASGTESLKEDERARRRKDFQPLAHLDEGRGVDPYRAAETAPPITWLPQRGTEHRVTAPVLATELLDPLDAALRLAPRVQALGGSWGPDQYQWLAQRYAAGVPVDALEALARECAPGAPADEPAPELAQAAGLRLVR
ncbi:MAG: DDE-type integrase/transposase/recombinase [Chromatiaceae bacterium]|nr:DDE-type integrase/transposase/recombinase [Chromatiaceae bacterium]